MKGSVLAGRLRGGERKMGFTELERMALTER
jgi:hypothetical protein